MVEAHLDQVWEAQIAQHTHHVQGLGKATGEFGYQTHPKKTGRTE